MDNMKSPLYRVGIRKMILYIEKTVAEYLTQHLFEINSEKQRHMISLGIKHYLEKLQFSDTSIYDYRVVCDETNNPPEVVDRHELYVDIQIQPYASAEYINLNFSVTSHGAEFSNQSINVDYVVSESLFRMD